jgi:ketosteroid isomerase-like protein
MAERGHIEQVIRALYAARIADDIEGTLKDVAEDGVFKMNARGLPVEGAGTSIDGKGAVREAVAALIKDWKFEDWTERSLLVDGDRAALHWQANVTNRNTGKRALMDGLDLITFRAGKITKFRQNVDTAMMMQLAG